MMKRNKGSLQEAGELERLRDENAGLKYELRMLRVLLQEVMAENQALLHVYGEQERAAADGRDSRVPRGVSSLRSSE